MHGMLENINSETIKSQFKTNKKFRLITGLIIGIIIGVIGFLLYKQFIVKPKEVKSQDAYWAGMNFAVKDSTDAAIEELSATVKKYDGYTGGENAQYLLGCQYMKKGEYKKAIENFEDVNTKDTYIAAISVGLQGDCYSELGDYKKAVEMYVEASEVNTNDWTTPMYLFKAGLNAEELKDYEAASGFYQTIKDDYVAYAQKKSIDKYLARATSKK